MGPAWARHVVGAHRVDYGAGKERVGVDERKESAALDGPVLPSNNSTLCGYTCAVLADIEIPYHVYRHTASTEEEDPLGSSHLAKTKAQTEHDLSPENTS